MSEPTEKPSETDKKPKTKKKVKVFNKKKKQQDPENVVIEKLKAKYETIDSSAITKFSDLPLSAKTLKGLRECKYHKPTDIQKETIALALQGKDILGAAQTGSGKTLAFLVPILEHLFCKQWTRLDGLGALVLTPTRELAYQIFETLRKVGEHHDFSAGLIIGGKDLKFERNRMDQCNIMICTPGRLLQHMDENPLFDCVNMQILVLDEADRCLDMGFQQTMNSIIANLPLQRQTLLFSATQTKSVKDLARLSLKDPKYISVHEHSEFCTPKELQQSYMVCELQDKVSILWSFIKNHLKQKIIIFFSSCKQVKYMFEIFSKLRPGTSLMALYGTLHQLRRMEIYENFCKKSTAVLFATDLAARGLDFPQVHWVVQADCPEDVATYIHRVGRTARYHRGGESLLLLLKSETAMIDKMIERKIPITSTEINPTKLNNPVRKMEAFLAKDPPLKDTAQRAFVSYAKAVFLMKDKQIFNIQSLDTDSYAHSLGLAIPPRIRFLQRMNKAVLAEKIPKKPQKVEVSQNKTYFNSDDEEEAKPTASKLVEKVEAEESEDEDEIQTTNLKPTTKQFHVSSDEGSDDEGNILQVKRRDHDVELPTDAELAEMHLGRNPKKKAVTKAAAAKKLLKKKIVPNKKIFFDDEGEVVTSGLKDKKSEMAQEYENEDDMCGIDIEKAKLILREEDKFDKQLFKEKIKAKHKEEKRKLKEQNKQKKLEENEEQDDFGEDESEGEQPDLSWMPDPDQLYGKKEDNSEDEPEFYNKSQEEEEETMKILTKPTTKEKSKKRKKPPKGVDNLETVIKRKKKQKFEEISSALSVNEAEELAMMLLNKK